MSAPAVASKWVVGIDALLFVFILAPLSPPALSRPAGREREPTAIFGRVNKQRQYTRQSTLNSQKNFEICNLNFDIGFSGFPAVEAVLSSAAAGGSGRALFERSEFSPTPPDASSARDRAAALTSAAFSFGYFDLGKQRKVSRLPGRDPACCEALARNQFQRYRKAVRSNPAE